MAAIRQSAVGEIKQLGGDFLVVENLQCNTDNLSLYEIKGYVLTILCHKGYADVEINFKPYRLSANQMLIILSGQKMLLKFKSKNFCATHFFMSSKFVSSLEIGNAYVFHESVMQVPILSLPPKIRKAMITYRDMACNIVDNADSVVHAQEGLRLLTKLFFLTVGWNIHPRKEKIENDPVALIDRFRSLVKRRFHEHRDVAYYAAELCLTPKYLSTYVKRCTGRSASAEIENYVILEAKSLLSSTTLSVRQIADTLNFSTQTLFGRYFKRLTGYTASQYRASVQGKG